MSKRKRIEPHWLKTNTTIAGMMRESFHIPGDELPGHHGRCVWNNLDQSRRKRLRAFADRLLELNRHFNLTGAREANTLHREHILDSMTLVPAIREFMKTAAIDRARLIDVGSGCGFPALPLAIVLDFLDVVCIESVGKKARALSDLAAAAGLEGLVILHDRAERLAHDARWRETADLGTARAVGHLATVAELVLPFLRIGGKLLAQKGPYPSAELEEARCAISELGARVENVVHLKAARGDAHGSIVIIEKTDLTPDRYPRGPGKPAKRPLGVAPR